MKVVYVPLYRCAVSYTVSFGRRWSVLEQLLLIELCNRKSTAAELGEATNLPDRLVIEALTNLLGASWIEIRSTDAGVTFAATSAGRRWGAEEELEVKLHRTVRWISLCADRLTGAWFRADDLDLVYDRDVPDNAYIIEPRLHTYDANDSSLRDLLHLNPDEALEPVAPEFRTASRPYARLEIAFDGIQSGLPSYAPIELRQVALTHALSAAEQNAEFLAAPEAQDGFELRDDISAADLVIGGPEHRAMLQECLESTDSMIVIHSCFLNGDTVERLLPDFEAALRRKVRIELIWGLNSDPESVQVQGSVAGVERVLGRVDKVPDPQAD